MKVHSTSKHVTGGKDFACFILNNAVKNKFALFPDRNVFYLIFLKLLEVEVFVA